MNAVGRPCRILGVNQNVESVAGQVDDWCGVNGDVRPVVGAADWKADGFSEVRFEQYRTGFGIDGVDRFAFGGDVNDVMKALMSSGGDGDAGNKQRMSVDLIIQWD